jgi:hypothetical protein
VRHAGHISAGGVDTDVVFENADHDLDDEIDEEYRRKYGRSSTAVDHITSRKARSTTVSGTSRCPFTNDVTSAVESNLDPRQSNEA